MVSIVVGWRGDGSSRLLLIFILLDNLCLFLYFLLEENGLFVFLKCLPWLVPLIVSTVPDTKSVVATMRPNSPARGGCYISSITTTMAHYRGCATTERLVHLRLDHRSGCNPGNGSCERVNTCICCTGSI